VPIKQTDRQIHRH